MSETPTFKTPPIVEFALGVPFSSPAKLSSGHSLDKAEWASRIEELGSFRSLENNWDGDESSAPGVESVDWAISLARALQEKQFQPPDRVVVGMNGTIFLEWHLPSGYYEIEVLSPTDAEARWIKNGCQVAEVTTLRRDTNPPC